jgi:hypothetical protein
MQLLDSKIGSIKQKWARLIRRDEAEIYHLQLSPLFGGCILDSDGFGWEVMGSDGMGSDGLIVLLACDQTILSLQMSSPAVGCKGHAKSILKMDCS